MMQEIKAIIRPERLSEVLQALDAMPNLPGVTISTVQGCGRRYPLEAESTFAEVTMTQLEIVVSASVAMEVAEVVERAAPTGRVGDGKIFVILVEHAIKIRWPLPAASSRCGCAGCRSA
jgi:nitrogen regulatory protein PII